MALDQSELILNPDNSIYHLHLLPQDIAPTIITVGDPERVDAVSQYFDHVDIKKQNREFKTHTGHLNGKPLTVISTGIGSGNIDIVLNELDALVNIDFKTRTPKSSFNSLEIIRLGTSGAIQPDIPLDSFLLSEYAMGFDNLPYYYRAEEILQHDIQLAFVEQSNWSVLKSVPYVVQSDLILTEKLNTSKTLLGFTATQGGFYGPQGRKLRLPLEEELSNDRLQAFRHNQLRITNLEMETAAIYCLCSLMGHSATSINCVLANRYHKTFSSNPNESIDQLIQYTLERLSHY